VCEVVCVLEHLRKAKMSLEPQKGVCENKRQSKKITQGECVCELIKPKIIVQQGEPICVSPTIEA